MNQYQACEQAYKNGFEAGAASKLPSNPELATRVKVAYELLSQCHSAICGSHQTLDTLDTVRTKLHDVLLGLLDIQVDLGVLKREEDIK
jgi:hypothetical protein